MPGCRGAGPSFGTAGACPGGFWRAGWGAGQRDQVIEIAADAAGGEAAGLAAAFPGHAVVFGVGGWGAVVGGVPGDEPGAGGGPAGLAGRADDGAGGARERRGRG